MWCREFQDKHQQTKLIKYLHRTDEEIKLNVSLTVEICLISV